MGEAKKRSYEEQRRINRGIEIRKTWLPRTVKAVLTFLMIVTLVPIALYAAYQGFQDDELLWGNK